MAYDLIKISGLPLVTPDSGQDIVVGVGDLAKRINYGDVKADMVGTSPSYTADTEPYLMRQTAHTGVVGKCALNKLVGGSLGWNQLIPQITATASQNGISYASTGNGTWTITGALESGQTQGWYNLNYTANVQKILSGHVYYVRGCDAEMRLQFVGNSVLATFEAEKIVKVTLGASDTSTWVRFQTLTHATLNKTLTPQVLDLTAMFGSTIADYVYGLEQATAGSGIAWLRKYIDIDSYHAYDAGSIQSVQATAHVTKDANNNVIGNYPLGSDTLRGYPMLVNNKLVFDGDIKTPDGTIRRRYGIVDLGSLTWSYSSSAGTYFNATIPSVASSNNNVIFAFVVPKYTRMAWSDWYSSTSVDKSCAVGSDKRLYIRDTAYSDATAFKSSLSGMYLVYLKDTETTESSTPYQHIQPVDPNGIEQFVCSSPVPVGHETQTPDNILSALEWLGE